VIGQNWYFLILLGRHYAISGAFSAISDEAFYIIGLLKTLKFRIACLIEERMAQTGR
jgi:hypothetical protein